MALNNGPLDNLCCLQLGDDGDCVASSTACKRIQAQMTHGWFTTDLPRDSTFFFVIARTADKRNVRDKHFGPGDTGKARHTATSHHTFKLCQLANLAACIHPRSQLATVGPTQVKLGCLTWLWLRRLWLLCLDLSFFKHAPLYRSMMRRSIRKP